MISKNENKLSEPSSRQLRLLATVARGDYYLILAIRIQGWVFTNKYFGQTSANEHISHECFTSYRKHSICLK